MNLLEFTAQLNELVEQGHGDKLVFYRHGASGDCGELSSAVVTNIIEDDTGPFDLEPNEYYVSIYAGS